MVACALRGDAAGFLPPESTLGVRVRFPPRERERERDLGVFFCSFCCDFVLRFFFTSVDDTGSIYESIWELSIRSGSPDPLVC